MSDNTTRAARCEYRCQYAEDVGMTGHSCAQECLYRDAAGGSPGAETPPLDDYAKQDFNERLASIKRCIPHMADVGGIWPRDVEWLIGQLASQSATISTLQQQLADAVLTARYQSDVARQADEAREKAEQQLAQRHKDFDELYHVWEIEHPELLQARKQVASLQAEVARSDRLYIEAAECGSGHATIAALQAENAGLRAELELARGRLAVEDGMAMCECGHIAGAHHRKDLRCRSIIDGQLSVCSCEHFRATPTPPQERK
jgi:hypothetical protein